MENLIMNMPGVSDSSSTTTKMEEPEKHDKQNISKARSVIVTRLSNKVV